MDERQAVEKIGRIMDALVAELREMGEEKSCIGAGAVLTNVLHRCGFPEAYPLTVRVRIMNPTATNMAEAAGWKESPLPAKEGAFCISVGEPTDNLKPEVWPGHLVVIIPNVMGDKHTLCDPTIVQADHPESGINLAPLCFRVMDDFTSGEKVRKLAVNGSTLVYKAFPEEHSYREKSNWEKLVSSTVVVDRVLARLHS